MSPRFVVYSPCARANSPERLRGGTLCRSAVTVAGVLLILSASTAPAQADPGFPPPLASSSGNPDDPIAVLQRAEMWHVVHNTGAELREYADDAVVTISPPPVAPGRAVYRGKSEVREYLEWSRQATGMFHERLCCPSVEQDGDTVTTTSQMTSDLLRQRGYDWVPVVDSFVVRDGLIQRYSMTQILAAPGSSGVSRAPAWPQAWILATVLGCSAVSGLGVAWLLRRLARARFPDS